MLSLYVKLRNWFERQDGQGMVEYAMIVGLVAVGVLALLTLMGGQISDIFSAITKALSSIGGVRQPPSTTP